MGLIGQIGTENLRFAVENSEQSILSGQSMFEFVSFYFLNNSMLSYEVESMFQTENILIRIRNLDVARTCSFLHTDSYEESQTQKSANIKMKKSADLSSYFAIFMFCVGIDNSITQKICEYLNCAEQYGLDEI